MNLTYQWLSFVIYQFAMQMWALGIILHIMLVGCHPFDLTGDLPDTKISKLVCSKKTPPSLEKDSPMTSHLSDSAMDVIRRLLAWDPNKRLTAAEMLEHPWVRGETARKDKISGSDKKLSKFRVFKSRLEAKVLYVPVEFCIDISCGGVI